jgi:hypothetical protein
VVSATAGLIEPNVRIPLLQDLTPSPTARRAVARSGGRPEVVEAALADLKSVARPILDRRVLHLVKMGLTPTGKRGLVTAHATSRL